MHDSPEESNRWDAATSGDPGPIGSSRRLTDDAGFLLAPPLDEAWLADQSQPPSPGGSPRTSVLRSLLLVIVLAVVVIGAIGVVRDIDFGDDAVREASVSPGTGRSVAALLPDASPFLAVDGVDALPDGVPAEVSIITMGRGTDSGGALPIVIRNRTDVAVTQLEVTGSAREPSGSVVDVGQGISFAPLVVGPGEVAVGVVFFSGVEVSADAEFDLEVTAVEATASDPLWIDLTVDGHDRTGDSLTVQLRNPTVSDLSSTQVLLVCFDDASRPLWWQGAYATEDVVGAGSSVPVTVEFYDLRGPCDRYIAGGFGQRQR